jgi:NAD(P)-dependent dehydrogenase (short-subunit alcohol dehydrogenase family)
LAGSGRQVEVIAADISTADGAGRAIEAAMQSLGRLDVLVNNAGITRDTLLMRMSDDDWDAVLTTNLKGAFLTTKAAIRPMLRQRSGRIVNITSPASRMALPNYAAYAASKAGVDSITRGAAIALAPFGVTVNSVAPGMMDTDMQRSTEADLARLEGRTDVEAFLAERTGRVPLGRRAEIEEVAATVVWLALDAPAYVTAERLNASGGLDRD